MKRTSVKYEILSKLPIEVVVDADATSATICWDYKATICYDNNECKTDEVPSTQCQNVEIEPNDTCEEKVIEGELKWQRKKIQIPYRIVQKANPPEHCKCEPPFEGDKYELLDYWFEPSNVVECEGDSLNLHYKYNKLTVNTATCEIETEELEGEKVIHTICDLENNHIKRPTLYTSIELPDGAHQIKVGYICNSCNEECQVGTKIKVGGISYDVLSYTLNGDKKENVKHTTYITCQGYKKENSKVINEVYYTVEYALVTTDEECFKTEKTGVYEGIWKPSACDGDDCCSTHYVTASTEVTIDGSSYNVDLSILMKGDSERICNKNCECQPTIMETTYCVDENSAVVYYPYTDINGVKQWTTDGKVSKYGGEIKVKFHYSGHTIQIDCEMNPTDNVTEGDYEEIINVSPCWCPNDPNCRGTLIGEIEFKNANSEGCNVLEYQVKQEICDGTEGQ